MGEIYTMNDWRNELNKRNRKEARKEKVSKCWNSMVRFIDNNKEMIVFLSPIVIGVGGACVKGFKLVNRKIDLKKEADLKNLYCYDRSLGHYWKLRRELTNQEWIEIDQRKNRGERLSDILNELKVLK